MSYCYTDKTFKSIQVMNNHAKLIQIRNVEIDSS